MANSKLTLEICAYSCKLTTTSSSSWYDMFARSVTNSATEQEKSYAWCPQANAAKPRSADRKYGGKPEGETQEMVQRCMMGYWVWCGSQLIILAVKKWDLHQTTNTKGTFEAVLCLTSLFLLFPINKLLKVFQNSSKICTLIWSICLVSIYFQKCTNIKDQEMLKAHWLLVM